jgi:hypothetical protein
MPFQIKVLGGIVAIAIVVLAIDLLSSSNSSDRHDGSEVLGPRLEASIEEVLGEEVEDTTTQMNLESCDYSIEEVTLSDLEDGEFEGECLATFTGIDGSQERLPYLVFLKSRAGCYRLEAELFSFNAYGGVEDQIEGHGNFVGGKPLGTYDSCMHLDPEILEAEQDAD